MCVSFCTELSLCLSHCTERAEVKKEKKETKTKRKMQTQNSIIIQTKHLKLLLFLLDKLHPICFPCCLPTWGQAGSPANDQPKRNTSARW